MERGGSRNSSNSSLVDMEEMTNALFRCQDHLLVKSESVCSSQQLSFCYRGKRQLCNGPSGLGEMVTTCFSVPCCSHIFKQ